MNTRENNEGINEDEKMKECPKCGWIISELADFCPNCEYKFVQYKTSQKAKEKEKSKKGKYSLIIGILALLFSFTQLGIPLAVVGVILAFYVMFSKKELNYGSAIAGLILSLLAIGVSYETIGNNGASENNNTARSPEKTEMSNMTEFSVEEFELYNKKGISVICTGNKSKNNISFGFYAENNSENDINIYFSSIGINNITFSEDDIENYINEEVMPGNKTNFSVDVDKELLYDNNIHNIKKIEFMLVLCIGDLDGIPLHETLYADTNDGKYAKINGTLIYSDNNFDVQYLDNSGNTFKFSVHNNTDKYMDYYINKCSVNDYSFNAANGLNTIADIPVFSNSYSMFELTVDDEFCAKNSIERIEKLEFNMYAETDPYLFMTDGDIKTDRIEVKFK